MAQHKYDDLFPPHEAAMYADMDQAITKAGLWDWLKEYTPDPEQGFMFTTCANLETIVLHLKMGGLHSGASIGITFRVMESIAKKGWDNWVAEVKLRRKTMQ